MKIKLNKYIQDILNILNKNGKAYVVGGYIRDQLLNFDTDDIDIVTNIPAKKIKELLGRYRPKILNTKYEILSIKLPGAKCEIARLRKDIGVNDGRNPQKVEFVSDIQIDLQRRDFTINSFAYDGNKIYSYSGAKQDLDSKLIRMIKDPNIRLKEDKTRILRAFYLVAKYNFDLENELSKSINSLSKTNNLFPRIINLNIYSYFKRIIVQKYNYKAIKLMYELNVLQHIIPAFKKTKSNDIKVDRLCSILENNDVYDFEIIISIILIFAGKKADDNYEKEYEKDCIYILDNFNKRFQLNIEQYQMIRNLVFYHTIVNKNPTIVVIKKMLLAFKNNKNLCRLIYIIKLIFNDEKQSFSKLLAIIQGIYLAEEPVCINDLEISSIDLYNLNIPNKRYSQIKEALFKDVLSGRIYNSKYELIEQVLKKNKKHAKLSIEIGAGAIVYRKINGKIEFLIIKGYNQKSITFPKGHIEYNETQEQTAIREVKEETNIDIEIIDSNKFKKKMKYLVNEDVYKEVNLFIGRALNYEIKPQRKEIDYAMWVDFKKALNLLTFSQQRIILKQAMLYLYDNNER